MKCGVAITYEERDSFVVISVVGLGLMVVVCMQEGCEVGDEANVLIGCYFLDAFGMLLVGVCVYGGDDSRFGSVG